MIPCTNFVSYIQLRPSKSAFNWNMISGVNCKYNVQMDETQALIVNTKQEITVSACAYHLVGSFSVNLLLPTNR